MSESDFRRLNRQVRHGGGPAAWAPLGLAVRGCGASPVTVTVPVSHWHRRRDGSELERPASPSRTIFLGFELVNQFSMFIGHPNIFYVNQQSATGLSAGPAADCQASRLPVCRLAEPRTATRRRASSWTCHGRNLRDALPGGPDDHQLLNPMCCKPVTVTSTVRVAIGPGGHVPGKKEVN
jgi:hypothetical protein